MSMKKTPRRSANNAVGEGVSLSPETVARFFQVINLRAWTDAEKEMDGIRQKAANDDWSKGYNKALEGILLSFRGNDDKYIFLPKVMQDRNESTIAGLKQEFAAFSRSIVHGDYDRGFFRALEDYLTLGPATVPQQKLETSNRPSQESGSTLETDEE